MYHVRDNFLWGYTYKRQSYTRERERERKILKLKKKIFTMNQELTAHILSYIITILSYKYYDNNNMKKRRGSSTKNAS